MGLYTSRAEHLQQIVRGAKVMKAFNTQLDTWQWTARYRALDDIRRGRRRASEAADDRDGTRRSSSIHATHGPTNCFSIELNS